MILADPEYKVEINEDNKHTKTGIHSFRTSSSSMTVIAWHGNSSTWPEDENSAMLNNTIINWFWANHDINKNIRTK